MGLGKTLTMIALIASDAYNPMVDYSHSPSGVLGEESSGPTLVIVPPACKNFRPAVSPEFWDKRIS